MKGSMYRMCSVATKRMKFFFCIRTQKTNENTDQNLLCYDAKIVFTTKALIMDDGAYPESFLYFLSQMNNKIRAFQFLPIFIFCW